MAKKKKNRKIRWQAIRDQYVIREDAPSLRALAKEFKLDKGQISRKSTADQWKKRRKIYWDKITTKLQRKSTAITVDRLSRNKKLVEFSLSTVFKAIKKGGIKASFADLDKLIRLDEFLHGNKSPGEDGSFEEFVKGLMRKRIGEHKAIEAYKKKKEQPVMIDAEVVDDGTDKT